MPCPFAIHSGGEPQLPVRSASMREFAADPIRLMRRLHAEHGDAAALEDEGFRVHFIFSAALNQQVLSDSKRFHSQFFAVRGSRRSSQRRLTEGLLSMNGEQHKRQRRLVKEPFSRKSIVEYGDAIQRLAVEMVDAWTPGQTVDINEHMTRFMLKTSSALLFGLDAPQFALEIGEMTHHWVHYNHLVGPLAFAPHEELNGVYEELLAFSEQLEAKVLDLIQMRRSSGELGHDVLSLLIQANDAEGGITDKELVGHVTLLFAASHLTTAHTLTWTLLLLAQHPDVMRSLAEELDRELGGRLPTPADLDRLEVLDRVLKESMRIMPASSYSQRFATESMALGPFQLRPGSLVIFSQFMTHHSAALYDEPDRFLPDRWQTISPSPYAYLPFGAGPRMCVGAPLAMQILKQTLPVILQQYKVTCVPHSRVEAKVVSTMLNPMLPVWMTLDACDGKFISQPIAGNIHELVQFPPATAGGVERRRAA